MGTIKIEGMKFYAFHGHFEAEQIVGNNFEVNLKIKTDCNNAAISDDLQDALNYQIAYDIVKKEMEQNSKLLENVAKRILHSLHAQFQQIIKVQVKISKMNPPMGGEIGSVSVILSR